MEDLKTTHEIFFSNSNSMDELDSESIDLIVTSPPYPMIEMWDGVFSRLNEHIKMALSEGNDRVAFGLMHEELARSWTECMRVLKKGGMICINVGDATRSFNGEFQMYSNHSEITNFFCSNNFVQLPGIIWRKQTNSPNKFMGSGMLPTNAYVTLEHEHILIFRKGRTKRKFKPKLEERYESAYFWEERNKWFSDLWDKVKGTFQTIDINTSDTIRERSAAFPLEIPYRLISMFSIYEDCILDPFWGTGTTSIAAALLKRNSVGYEINEGFYDLFREKITNLPKISAELNLKRMERHRTFIESRFKDEEKIKYVSKPYNFPVITRQEENIAFYHVVEVDSDDSLIRVTYDSQNL